MQEARLAAIFRLVAQIGATRLEIIEDRTRTYLSVFILGWEPNLQVITLGGTETQIAATQQDATVRQFQSFQN